MNKLFLDFETRSPLNLKEVGAWKYAMHPQTEIMCMGIGGRYPDPEVWDSERIKTSRLYNREDHEWRIVSHGSFEYIIYECILHRRLGWPSLADPKRWDDTMARAAMCGLPLSLDGLGQALLLKTPKDLEGRRVMQKLCKPLWIDCLGDPIYDEDPAKYARLYLYNQNDIRGLMELDSLLPELPPHERAIYELDLIINSRGVGVDIELCKDAAALADYLTKKLNKRLGELTNGEITAATRAQAIKGYLARRGIESETLDKAAVTALLERSNLPAKEREILSIRRQVGKSSTAKFDAAVSAATGDNRVRGVLQYHAAHTGRWGGRLIQPQNYPKGVDESQQSRIIRDIEASRDHPELFALSQKETGMEVLSSILRGTIVAAPGKTLVCADYNAIEARVLFWLAGETGALEAYRKGESPYVDMAREVYKNSGITKKTHPREYDLGKRAVLGCGYGMGATKFKATCKVQANLDITDELAERTVKTYRKIYSGVPNLWYSIERAAIEAVRNPTRVVKCLNEERIAWGISKDRRFLVCRLPSGRYLWYYKPEIRVIPAPYSEDGKETLCYWGEDPKTHQWVRLKTYGGALVENITQAVARDIMANGMLKAEHDGYQIVLTVHDEVVAEIDVDQGRIKSHSVEDFVKCLCDLPAWAAGCPITAEGWMGRRYRK